MRPSAGSKSSRSSGNSIARVVAYVGLGSNLGDRRGHLRAAIRALRRMRGVTVAGVSRIYESSPVGGPSQPAYLNAAVRVRTGLRPAALVGRLLAAERVLGRSRRGAGRNRPRVIDLDLLLHGDSIIKTPRVTVPHPRLHRRKFALKPVLDLDATVVHPGFRRPLKSFLRGLPTSQKLRVSRA